MENPEEILHSLEEFSKLKPKDIPRELEEYLCFVAKTGDPVYQWAIVKSLFREKLLSVITEFYESCPSIEVPPCPNVEVFNYETMKSFILEKLDTFAAAPFTVQRICELLTTPRKEYNRIDKYMRALEKNILVVSTTDPLNRRAGGNGAEGIVNGLESEHNAETNNSSSNDINVEEMDDTPVWSRISNDSVTYVNRQPTSNTEIEEAANVSNQSSTFITTEARTEQPVTTESVITCNTTENQPFVSIEPVVSDSCVRESTSNSSDITVTITAIPAAVQKRRDSIEPIGSSVDDESQEPSSNPAELEIPENKVDIEMALSPIISTSPPEPITPDAATIEIIPVVETSELLPNEAESCDIVTSNIPVVIMPPEVSTNVEQDETNEVTEDESNSPIQIPVISEITSGVSSDLDAESSIQSPIGVQEDSNSDDSTSINEPTSEVSEEVSTSTPALVTSTDLHSEVDSGSECTKETIVSSSDDLTSDVANFKCVQVLDENSCQEEPSIESIENSSEADDKLSDVEEFASSSTVTETMDINIEEETCQEAPSFAR